MFRVRWKQSAINELTQLWTSGDAALRLALTEATYRVDLVLEGNPHGQGESRSQGRRITFVPPLTVLFRVENDGQTVTVLEVGLLRRRRK